MIGQGRVPITKLNINPHKTTLTNYCALLANNEGVSIFTSVQPKNWTRYSVENLLISAMVLCCVVASTHYNIVIERQADIDREMKDSPEGVQTLYNMVYKANDDYPIFPIRPELIYSIDDTVIFLRKRCGEKLCRLVASKALKKSGTRSNYKCTDTNNMNGLRVKLTNTFQEQVQCRQYLSRY